jgi:hypothetical protein
VKGLLSSRSVDPTVAKARKGRMCQTKWCSEVSLFCSYVAAVATSSFDGEAGSQVNSYRHVDIGHGWWFTQEPPIGCSTGSRKTEAAGKKSSEDLSRWSQRSLASGLEDARSVCDILHDDEAKVNPGFDSVRLSACAWSKHRPAANNYFKYLQRPHTCARVLQDPN